MMMSNEEGFEDITTDKNGGLLKNILVEGTGDASPPPGCSVEVHYVGTLHSDGSKFDSSRDRPGCFKFNVGVGQVIKGWDEGICSMKRGEKCILRCRSDYAYGEDGSPPTIPGGATLNFEVELLNWKEKVKPARLMTPEERTAHAMKMKELGTEAFKMQDWAGAINRYEDGVEYVTCKTGAAHEDHHGHSHGGQPCSSGHGDDDEDEEDGHGMGHGHGAAKLNDEDKKLAVALLNNLAMVRLKMEDHERAKVDCVKALQYEPTNVKALFRRAQAELGMGNYANCVQDAARCLELEPKNKEAELLRRKAVDDEKKAKQKEKAMYSKMFG